MPNSLSSHRPPILFIIVAFLFLGFQSCATFQKSADQPKIGGGIDQPSLLSKIDSVKKAEESTEKPQKAPTFDTDTIDVDTLLSQMTLREKIGQLFFIRANGNFQSEDHSQYQKLLRQVKKYGVGGITFFSGDIYAQAVMTNKLQQTANIPLWISQDMEYGAAMRVNGTTRFTPAMGVAATQNPDYAYWMGKITAQEAKALGVHQVYAPVLDVNNNPLNPVINVRSFSADPDVVSLFGNKFIEGVQSENVISTAKHFPGHGDTDIDSHLSLPVIKYDFARLDSLELKPFRSAINNGLNSIMSAHIAFPKISPDTALPATMDPSIVNGILADSLDFKGMVVSDGLEMRGISSHFSPGKAVIEALKAGVDLMLLSPDELTAIHEIELAVQSGKISEERIDQSVRKLLQWKKQKNLFEDRQVDIDSLSGKINRRSNQLIADEISRKSLTLLKNDDAVLPIRANDHSKIMVVSVSDGSSGNAGSSFVSQLRNHHPDVVSHVLDKRTSKEEKEEMRKDAKKADLIIIGSFVYVRTGEEAQMRIKDLDLLKDLTDDKPSALIAFGNPYIVEDLPDTEVQLLAWSANSSQVRNTVPALFGGSEISGRLPINIPGMYSIDHGLYLPQTSLRDDEPEVAGLSPDSLNQIEDLMNEAVFDSTFPGGVVTVVRNGTIAYQEGFGYQTYEKLNAVEDDEIYDLASLTKVTATTPAIMKLVEEGKINLDDKVGEYISTFSEGDKKDITIENFLLHNSGLPSFRPYVDSLKTKNEIIKAIKNEPLTYEPETDYVYSDLGFILLAEIVEEVTGKKFEEYLEETFYEPLGMKDTFFNPHEMDSRITRRIPPTEIDTTYRDTTVHAYAHDERAYYLDGVAGHAGLFSTGDDLAKYTQMLLNSGWYAGRRYLEGSTIETFTKKQSERSNRAYGFDRKDDGFSTAGSLMSEQAFGHTGFTGTSYWIDPENDVAVIILTNRTYPYRSYGKQISEIRAKIADIVMSSITE
ncbi:MAG: glycoside hydrolase family 3 N-terminal domain-containing protein [Bacteroidota bacterium]